MGIKCKHKIHFCFMCILNTLPEGSSLHYFSHAYILIATCHMRSGVKSCTVASCQCSKSFGFESISDFKFWHLGCSTSCIILWLQTHVSEVRNSALPPTMYLMLVTLHSL